MEKSLGARLLCVAKSIPKCESLVDCGCDHGHVSIYAAINGIAKKITASDINQGPLNNADKEIAAARQQDKITTVLTNGLDGLPPHECVVIAGMGGETIVDIIGRAPWTKKDCTLVLQPMTRSETLREYLYSEGFSITNERFVVEGGHMYCVITASFCGKTDFESFEKYISRAALNEALAAEYTDKIISRIEYEVDHKQKAGAISEEEMKERTEIIKSLKKVRNAL